MAYTVEKDWTAHGLRCVAIAGERGYRCGYVAVKAGHPLHGVDGNQPCTALAGAWEKAKAGPIGKRGIIPILCSGLHDDPRPDAVFDVHGGLTYSGGAENGYPVEFEGAWWFGFDCNHAWDAPDPTLTGRTPDPFWEMGDDKAVRTLEYVVAECESLARQLCGLSKEGWPMSTATTRQESTPDGPQID